MAFTDIFVESKDKEIRYFKITFNIYAVFRTESYYIAQGGPEFKVFSIFQDDRCVSLCPANTFGTEFVINKTTTQ